MFRPSNHTQEEMMSYQPESFNQDKYVEMVKALYEDFIESYKKMMESFKNPNVSDLDKLIHLRNVLYLRRKADEHLYNTKREFGMISHEYHTFLRQGDELNDPIQNNFNKALKNRGLKRQTLDSGHMNQIKSIIEEFQDFRAQAKIPNKRLIDNINREGWDKFFEIRQKEILDSFGRMYRAENPDTTTIEDLLVTNQNLIAFNRNLSINYVTEDELKKQLNSITQQKGQIAKQKEEIEQLKRYLDKDTNNDDVYNQTLNFSLKDKFYDSLYEYRDIVDRSKLMVTLNNKLKELEGLEKNCDHLTKAATNFKAEIEKQEQPKFNKQSPSSPVIFSKQEQSRIDESISPNSPTPNETNKPQHPEKAATIKRVRPK